MKNTVPTSQRLISRRIIWVYNGLTDSNDSLDNLEVKFQLSIKTPLWENIFGDNGTLYVAYSQLAFWQAYNSKISAPFREINFEPELFLAFNTGYEFYGVTSQVMSIGFNHQSNGRSKPLSRSWNRIVATFPFSRGDTYIVLKPWFRIPEAAKDDENPHMEKYYGYGELQLLQKIREHTLKLMLRNKAQPQHSH
ncbi:phospholipase A [Trichlorobacter lovleyi]|uniref:phospholipase A n=1 Tax=Trichlorobacter lovleyi TaxID=313985 RepID=UPI003D0DE422